MGLLESLQGIAKIARRVADAELVAAVAEANVHAMDLTLANLEMQKQVGALENHIKELQAAGDLKAKLFKNRGFLFADGDPSPHCLVCWEHSGKLITLPPLTDGFPPRCLVCQNPMRGLGQAVSDRKHPESVAIG